MPVYYRSKQIIPGPFLELNRIIERSGDGTARQRGWKMVARGKLVAIKGSPDKSFAPSSTDPMDWFYTGSYNPPDTVPPDPSGSLVTAEHRVARLRDKMAAMTELFSVDGGWYEVQPFDGTAPVKFQPRINEIKYAEGKWFDYVDFAIEMEADCVYFGDTELCHLTQADNMPEESWSIEPADEYSRTYRLTHIVSATAKKRFDTDGSILAEGWEIARDLVTGGPLAGDDAINLLGFDSDQMVQTGILNLNDFEPFNHIRHVQTDEAAGKFTVTEIWLCFDNSDNFGDVSAGNAIEELQIDTRYSNDTGIFTVSLNGSITGLEEKNEDFEVTVTRYENALLRFNPIYSSPAIPLNRAQTYSGVTLNPNVVNSTVSRNSKHGVINYTIEYNDRADVTVAGALSEIISISIDNLADVVAKIGTIGRPAGPVLQDTISNSQVSITINAEIVVAAAKYGQSEPTSPVYNTLAKALSIIGSPTLFYVESDKETWIPRLGRYSRTSTFIWQ